MNRRTCNDAKGSARSVRVEPASGSRSGLSPIRVSIGDEMVAFDRRFSAGAKGSAFRPQDPNDGN